MTEVYNPKAVFPHAASLHQAFAHCAISPTAASRRSLGRVSVPMWPFNLSVRLPIVDLVSRYLTNYLIGREPIFKRIAPLTSVPCDTVVLCGITTRFQVLSPLLKAGCSRVTHPSATKNTGHLPEGFSPAFSVRLACVRRAASVRPEPGSNS